MIAKLPIDVKAIFWAKYRPGASAPDHPVPEFPMISSPDRAIPAPQIVHLRALLLYVDSDSNIVPDSEDYIGEILTGDAVTVSEGSAWCMKEGLHSAEVFQAFVRYNGEHVFSNPSLIRNPDNVDLDDISIVVTGFKAGILGLKRADEHAQTRVMSDIEIWRRVATMSDSVLMLAIGTNLSHDIEVAEHERGCDLLIEFADSAHPLAGEVRTFLRKMRNPRDIRHRWNVYRMVLIVRAIQRRALELAEGKHDTLAAILFQKREVEEWVGIVVQRASRMTSELSDKQPWWIGITDSLPRGIGQQRVRNFAYRLKGYIQELERVCAKPFQPWATRAANAMRAMVTGFEGKQYGKISENARKAVAALRAVGLREQISIAVLLTHDDDMNDRPRIIEALMAARAWARDYAPILGIAEQAAPILDALDRKNDAELSSLEATLRKIELIIDNIG